MRVLANDDELPQTARWARVFAHEGEASVLAALAVVCGIVADPALLRRIADRLEPPR